MQLSYGDDTLEHIGSAVGIGLMKHSLVAVAGSARLVCINPRYNKYFILYLVGCPAKAGNIVKHRLAAVRGAGTYYQNKLIGVARKNFLKLGIPFLLNPRHLLGNGIVSFYLLRNRKLAKKFHIHILLFSPILFCQSAYAFRLKAASSRVCHRGRRS